MRRFRFLKYVFSSAAIVILVAGALYFPKIYNYRQDSKDFNRVHTYEQDEISLYVRDDISVSDRMKELTGALKKLDNGEASYYMVQLEEDFNKEYFIEQVNKEIARASECGLIPDISAYCNQECDYSIQCIGIESYDSDLVDFKYWSIEFVDFEGEYNFIFIIDYDTYMIYRAQLYCEKVEEWIHSNYFEGSYNNFNAVSTACMQYYMPDEIRIYDFLEKYEDYITFKLLYGEDCLFFCNQILYEESTNNLTGIAVGIFI